MKRQKRWTTEAEILAAIDRAKSEQGALATEAENLLSKHRGFLKLSFDPRLTEDFQRGYAARAKECLDESDELFAKSARKEIRLKTLGEKLSAMRTGLLVGITDDPSVV